MPIVKDGRIAGSSILCLNKVRKNKRDKEQKMHYFIRDFTELMLTDIAHTKKERSGRLITQPDTAAENPITFRETPSQK